MHRRASSDDGNDECKTNYIEYRYRRTRHARGGKLDVCGRREVARETHTGSYSKRGDTRACVWQDQSDAAVACCVG